MDEENIFLKAVGIDSPDQRAAFLDEACGHDEQLRSGVESLLRHHKDAGSFLENPPEALVATIATGEFDTVDEGGTISLDFLQSSDKPGCIGTLGVYEVVEVVGRGGMGIVLRALDTKLNRVVAIKAMAPALAANAMAVKRFLREARAAAAVSHNHVVTIHAIDEDHRPPFIVMECVDGESLQQKIDRVGAFDVENILRIGMQMARGLAAAHEQGLVHRDIKPANILLENGVERVKITDFGLARATDDVSVTQTGQIAGTPQYMSPEQAQGHAIDARSDLFSLGSVLYTMCTGRPPFRAESPLAMLRRVSDDTPRSICQVNAEVPDWLEAIIFKLLAKQPDARFQSAAEVAELLSQHLAHRQHPATAPLPQPIIPPVRQRLGAQPLPEEKCFEKPPYGTEEDDHPARRRTPRWSMFTAVAAMVGAAFLTALAATVIYVQTNYGVVRVEVLDPDVQVMLHGNRDQVLEIQDKNEILRMRPGDKSLRIEHGDLEFETDKFTVKRGEKVLVRVSRVKGDIEVRAGNTLIAQRKLPSTAKTPAAAITEVRRFGDLHTRPVKDIAYLPSAQGWLVATASEDGTVRIWDAQSGREAKPFLDLGEADPRSVAASPHGDTIAVGDHVGNVYVWDVDRAKIQRTLVVETGVVNTLAFSPDGRRLFVGMAQAVGTGSVVVYDATSWERLREFEEVDRGVTTLAPLAREPHVLATLWGRHGGVWDPETGRLLTRFRDVPASAYATALSPDGALAALGFLVSKGRGNQWDDPGIWLYDVATGRVVRKFRGHTGFVNDVAWSADGRFLVSGSGGHHSGQEGFVRVRARDSTLRVWDAETGAEIGRAAIESEWGVWRLALMPDGRHVVTASNDNGQPDLRLWRLPQSMFEPTKSSAQSEATTTGAPRAAMSGGGGSLTELREFVGKKGAHYKVAVDRNSQRILTVASHDDAARLWNIPDGGQIQQFPGTFAAAAFSPDGSRVLTGTHHPQDAPTNELIVWDIESGDKLQTLEASTGVFTDLTVSPNGRLAASTHGQWWGDFSVRDNTVRIWDLEASKLLHEIRDHTGTGQVDSVAFTPDGERILSCGGDGTVRLWDAETGAEVRQFQGTGTRVFAVDVSPDGRFVLAGFGPHKQQGVSEYGIDDPTHCIAILWDLQTGEEVRRFVGHHGAIKDVGFSPDGKLIVTASGAAYVGEVRPGNSNYRTSDDKTMRIWNAETGEQLAVVLHRTTVASAEFSPDGCYLVSGETQLFHLWRLPQSTEAWATQAAAADRQLLISSNRGGDFDIYLIDENGTGWQNLTGHPAEDTGPAWSPDGGHIAFCSSRSGNLDVWVMNADGSDPRQLTDYQGIDRTPCWSPDGKRIAFVRHLPDDNWEIFVMNADGSNQVNLSDHPNREADPAWSPDGTKIAFDFHADEGAHLHVMAPDGSNQRMLSPRPGSFIYPAWSPDGRSLVYTAWVPKVGKELELFIANADGSNERQLTRLGGLNTFAAFSPDGKRIAFQHRNPNKPGIKAIVYVMNADGTGLRPITGKEAHIGYGGGRPAWRPGQVK